MHDLPGLTATARPILLKHYYVVLDSKAMNLDQKAGYFTAVTQTDPRLASLSYLPFARLIKVFTTAILELGYN